MTSLRGESCRGSMHSCAALVSFAIEWLELEWLYSSWSWFPWTRMRDRMDRWHCAGRPVPYLPCPALPYPGMQSHRFTHPRHGTWSQNGIFSSFWRWLRLHLQLFNHGTARFVHSYSHVYTNISTPRKMHAVLRWDPPRYPPIGLHLLAAPVPVPGRYLFVGESLNERGQGCQVRSSYSTDGGGRKDAQELLARFVAWPPDIYVVFINDNFYYFNILSIWITDYCDFEFEIYGLL